MKSDGKDENGQGTLFANQHQVSQDRPFAKIPWVREIKGNQKTPGIVTGSQHQKEWPLMEPIRKDGPEQDLWQTVADGLWPKWSDGLRQTDRQIDRQTDRKTD